MNMLHNRESPSKLQPLLMFLLLVSSASCNFISMSVTSSNLQINQQGSYTFTINRQYDPVNFAVITTPTPVTTNSTIAITFPTQFLTTSPTTALPCTDSNGNDLGCTLNSATRKVSVANYYASSSTLGNTIITIIMPQIVGAYKAGATDNFFWQILYPNGSTIDQGPASTTNYVSTSLTFLPGTFQSCSITAAGAYVGSSSTLTFTLSPNNQIPSGGQIAINIPAFWSSDPLKVATVSSSKPACSAVSGLGSSSLVCSYDTSQGTITVSGINSTASSTFSFQISGIISPPTVGSGQTITLYSQWSDSTYIDSCTAVVGGLVAVPFQAITLRSNDNSTVQSSFSATLKLTLSMPFYFQDTIVFMLPSQFAGATVGSSNFATFTRTPGFNNALTLSSFPSTTPVIAANNPITFTLSNIKNALSVSPLTLNVTFYRSSQLYQTQITTYAATAGTLSSLSILPDSNFVRTVGQATLTLLSTLYFPANSQITVSYPSSVTVNSLDSTAVVRCTLNSTVVSGVTYSVSNNQIKFNNVFSSDFLGTVSLIIGIFTNPFTSQPSTYSLQVNDQNSHAVMSGSTTLTANTKGLVSNSVSASSSTVLDSGVTYSISMVTNYPFTSISIIIPPEVSVGASYGNTCAPNTFSSCTLVGRNLTFVGSLASGMQQLSWGYNTNPSSLQPTSSFQITTYFQGWSVQSSQGVISLTMSAVGTLANALVSPSSFKNSDAISVSLAMTFPALAPSGQLTVIVPSEIGLSSASCSGCTIVPPNVYYAYNGSSSLTLTLANVQNVASFKPVSNFTIKLANPSNYASLQFSAAGWTNSVASSFSTTVSGSNNYRGEANTFLLTLTSLPSSQSYVIIGFNSAFPGLSTAPSGGTLIDSFNIKFSCSGSSCSVNLPLTNPTASGPFTFSLTTFSLENQRVGISSSNSWNYDCALTQCRSCLANGSCVTCYNSSISEYYVFNSANSSCIQACSSGSFLVNTTCTLCSSNCSRCSGTSTRCTACPPNYYLETTNYVCVPSCLGGYYANALSGYCDQCSSLCSTCVNTSSSCLSCVMGRYLFGSECLSNCPANSHIANPSTSKCDSCSNNCVTCSGTINSCLSCNNSLLLYLQNASCVANCASNYFLVNSVCTLCYSPCKVCNQAINICASCFLNGSFPLYFNGTCIAQGQCPIGHYTNNTNSSCEICLAACAKCSSASICSLCSAAYYLSGSSCLAACPNTAFAVNLTSGGVCQTCNNCSTCSSASVCTSCVASQYLYLDVCYASCPVGTFISGSLCKLCSSDCVNCQNLTFCLQCLQNLYLYNAVCYPNCPIKSYANASSQSCISCPTSCASCSSPTNCINCSSGYSLEDNLCVLICSRGISYNQICLPCGLNCAICSNTTCTLCDDSYLLSANTCLTACPTNMLTMDNRTCVACTARFVNCSTCSASACLSCTYGQLYNGRCKPCDPGTYELSASCITCPSFCTTCSSQTNCQSCAPSYYMHEGACVGSCPRNMVPNGTICTQCAPQCNLCNLTTLLCSVCNAGVYLHNNSCYATCPSDLVASYDSLTCVTPTVYYQQFSKSAKIVFFPFTIATVALLIIGAILKCFHKEMHLQTVLCGVVSWVELLCWGLLLVFELIYWSNYHKTAFLGFVCSAVGVGMLLALNWVHLRFYYKYISGDEQFQRWQKSYGCSNCVMLALGSALTFKCYRLVHSKCLGRSELSMVLSNANKLVPFTFLSLLSVLLCSVPLGVGCALALYNSISQDQEFFIAFDVLVVTGIMLLLLIMDLRHPDDYFIDQHETKNLKRKIYEEDEVKFEKLGEVRSDEGSSGHIVNLEEDQADNDGDIALPSTGHKFKSTFQHTTRKADHGSKANLKADIDESGLEAEKGDEVQEIAKSAGERNEEDFEFEESEGEQEVFQKPAKGKWQPKQYDHHGYLVKYDQQNNPVKYDEHGYRVQIDQQGNHKKFDKDGNQVRIVRGKHLTYDARGYQLIDGVAYDQRGYQAREVHGELQFYDKNGCRVLGFGDEEKHIDEQGLVVEVDQQGKLRRYDEDGWEVVVSSGKRLLKNSHGEFVRKNKDNQWETYDPADGFTTRRNSVTSEIQKYDDLGFRVLKDSFGHITRYDQHGNTVTVLPGGTIVKHDSDGYRLETDSLGNIRRYDSQGYELVTEGGKARFIDQHGYTVERDIYGRVTLYDGEGLTVVIDQERGEHRKYNEEGLEVGVDARGNRILKDKRGKIVKELEQSYEKYDSEGNKIYLDDNGYEVEYDEEGNEVLYDKVGDRVRTDYQIEDSQDQFYSPTLPTHAKNKYKFKLPGNFDHELELQKLLTANQPFILDDDQEISELPEFHDYQPPLFEVGEELQRMVNKERSELVFDESKQELKQLKELQFKQEQEELQEHDIMMEGLETIDFTGGEGLLDKERNLQKEYDGQLNIREGKQPTAFRAGQHQLPGAVLADRETHKQHQFDREALLRDIDEGEPDVIALKQQHDRAAADVRKRELLRKLDSPREQQYIEIKSVADVSLDERSFQNEGVEPIENKTEDDQVGSLEGVQVAVAWGKRGNRSEVKLPPNKKDTSTVYNYNTVQVAIKNQQQHLYDEHEEIESLQEEDWEQQHPTVFARQPAKHEDRSSNANTNIVFIEDHDNKDTLTEFVHQSETSSKLKPLPRYAQPNELFSGGQHSIEEIEEQLFEEAKGGRERRGFKLSGVPNPLVEYAKRMEANRNQKSLQEKMYLDNIYKRS